MTLSRLSRSTFALILAGSAALAADGPTDPAKTVKDEGKFKLGEMTVMVEGRQDLVDQVNTQVPSEKIQEFEYQTLGSALTLMPGVNLSMNQRNEQIIFVRGNDARRVPMYLDGMPIYLPYEGQGDFGRFTTFGLSEIQVAKGYSSVAFGPNTLGGAINMVTRKPGEGFQGQAEAGLFDGEGRRATLSAGTNQGRWYLQADAGYFHAGDFPLSDDFQATPRQGTGNRTNSAYTDRRTNLKFGFTPGGTDEYVVGYLGQNMDREQPTAVYNSLPARYWQWPEWKKDAVYLTTNTALGDKSYVRVRAYYTGMQNTVYAYKDASFTTLDLSKKDLSTTGKRFYDDFTNGESLELGTQLVPGNSFKFVVQGRTDVHREDFGLGTWTHYQDQYLSFGAEDTIALADRWNLALGVESDHQKSVDAGPYALSHPASITNGQAGLYWSASDTAQIYATLAQKDRFGSLKDRYAQGNTYVANPDLRPERSLNAEIGGKFTVLPWLKVEEAVFLSDVRDLIQDVPNVQGTLPQMQNVGHERHTGVEMALNVEPQGPVKAGITYMYLDRRNLSDPTVVLTGTPHNRLFGYVRCQILPTWHVLASVDAQDAIWDNNTSSRLGGYATESLMTGWQPTAHFSVDAGLTNALDRNYQLSYGFPIQGRSWFVNTRYRF